MVEKTRRSRVPRNFESIQKTMVSSLTGVDLIRERLLEDLKDGKSQDCFAAHLFRNHAEFGLTDDETMFAGGSAHTTTNPIVLNAIEGGSDTTRATLNVFITAMATDSTFVERLRKQLDAVCCGRLPTLEDEERLPLVTACVKETIRWMPLVASGVVRVLIQDDHFENYYFPKGTRFSEFLFKF
jgi:hypothetical protein